MPPITLPRKSLLRLLALAAALTLLFLLRSVWIALAAQLFWAYLLMGAALPLCRLLERRLSPSLAATGAFALLALLGAGLLLLFAPALVRQFEQLGQALPVIVASLDELFSHVQQTLAERGIQLAPIREEALHQLQQTAAQLLPRAANTLRGAATAMSPVTLAPLLAFYLLRDHQRKPDAAGPSEVPPGGGACGA